jgi:hypothetical protein
MYSGLVSVSYIMEGYSCLEQFHGFVNWHKLKPDQTSFQLSYFFLPYIFLASSSSLYPTPTS